ncbi:hypothetical protein LTR36_006368 [Oleoguttula mirabilis]|uniref:NADP-dependent oxidoreductase domain-containing protein n=1 Tax=Oleoguttula mirabilis TaxID=1507867 RepID=A0AAV9JUP2_9PEZI|nr:hypothetical protein LTR36_006368 [Oleoguttula mirabilis]
MAGHVNMMDDVLISNLPPTLLRSSLRILISQGSATQQPFVEHVREWLRESSPKLLDPQTLFPEAATVSPDCLEYLALTSLSHFVDSLTCREATWLPGSDLDKVVVQFGGDVVQAIQALKESRPEPTAAIERQLQELIKAFDACKAYCANRKDFLYPFARPERQSRDVLCSLYPQPVADTNHATKQLVTLSIEPAKSSGIETFRLGPHEVPRLFNGLWQLSSPAWGSGTADAQEEALVQLVTSGLTATDMADHYGDAELIYGDFRNKLIPELRDQVYAATKWCVFGPINRTVTSEWVLEAVKERSRRLGGRVELLQFHWHDYAAKEYLKILAELVIITKTHPDLVSSIGLCNFDSEHTREVCTYLLEKTGSVGIVSNQIQFSLFDSRPIHHMSAVCDKFGLKLLTYGFLSDRWKGEGVPQIYSETAQLTPSQRKYFDMIKAWGSWQDFQSLLEVLSKISQNHDVSLTNVATRWVLQQPNVGAVIVGTRLGVSNRGGENLKAFSFQLDDGEMRAINDVALGVELERSFAMLSKLGDCGNEYRAMH